MRACAHCREELEERFRFCPWCGAAQRVKLVEFFRAHPLVEGEGEKALRVSRYLTDDETRRHVRFSVWGETGATPQAEAAVSLSEDDAARLARFLAEPGSVPELPGVD